MSVFFWRVPARWLTSGHASRPPHTGASHGNGGPFLVFGRPAPGALFLSVPLAVNSLFISLLFQFSELFERVESFKTFVLFSSILCALFSIVLGFIDTSNNFSIQDDSSLPME